MLKEPALPQGTPLSSLTKLVEKVENSMVITRYPDSLGMIPELNELARGIESNSPVGYFCTGKPVCNRAETVNV